MSEIRERKLKRILTGALLGAALCLSASVKPALSQQTASSTQPQQAQTPETEAARRLRLIEALERAQDEVKASRKYVAALEASVKSKQAVIDAQVKRQSLSDEAIAALQSEVADAKAVIGSQQATIAAGGREIDYLKQELAAVNKKLRRARAVEKYLIVGIGALILTSVLK